MDVITEYFTSLGTFGIVAQVFGLLGIIGNILIMQQKSRKMLLTFKLISDVLWTLHYLFLFAYSGFAICLISVFREIISINRKSHKWADCIVWPVLFITAAVGSAFLTWKGPVTLLTTCASILAIISFWIGKPRLSRIMAFPIGACMISYDILIISIVGIVNEAFALVSAVVGIIRLDILKRREAVEAASDVQKEAPEEKNK